MIRFFFPADEFDIVRRPKKEEAKYAGETFHCLLIELDSGWSARVHIDKTPWYQRYGEFAISISPSNQLAGTMRNV